MSYSLLVENDKYSSRMGINLGDEFPDFEADTTDGKISFHNWINDSYVHNHFFLLFVYICARIPWRTSFGKIPKRQKSGRTNEQQADRQKINKFNFF